MQEKNITSFDQVIKADVKYFFVDKNGKRNGKYIHIQTEQASQYYDGIRPKQKCYTLHRKLSDYPTLYSFVTKGDYVHAWKTISGVIRYVKKNYS